MSQQIFKGIVASSGLALGKAQVITHKSFPNLEAASKGAEEEIRRFELGRDRAVAALKAIQKKAGETLVGDEAEIFEAHEEILLDDELAHDVKKKLSTSKLSAEKAVKDVLDESVEEMASLPAGYAQERMSDLQDVLGSLIWSISGKSEDKPGGKITKDAIIVSDFLTPSDTVKMDLKKVSAFITKTGGATSHVALIAQTHGIPAIFGIPGDFFDDVDSGSNLVVDALKPDNGEVYLNPEKDMLSSLEKRQKALEKEAKELEKFKGKEAISADGKKMTVASNIGTEEDLPILQQFDARDVGLMRTEFLFMGSSNLPGEEQQFPVYKKFAQSVSGRVIIRTADIGGDKDVPYLNIAPEENPFLGCRGIRLALKERETILIPQLRAILRASAFGRLSIMLPMIASVLEIREVKSIVEELKAELRKKGQSFDPDIPVGVMIETPAAAIAADQLATEADFFSIGSNDLTQYTLAVERGNTAMNYLYSVYHPAVLALLAKTVRAAKKAGIFCGLCGAAGAKPPLFLFLASLGISEVSVPPAKMLQCVALYSKINVGALASIADEAIAQDNRQDAKAFLRAKVQEILDA